MVTFSDKTHDVVFYSPRNFVTYYTSLQLNIYILIFQRTQSLFQYTQCFIKKGSRGYSSIARYFVLISVQKVNICVVLERQQLNCSSNR